MNRQRCFRAAMLTVAAIALISLAACGDDTALLPREAIVPPARPLIDTFVALPPTAVMPCWPVAASVLIAPP